MEMVDHSDLNSALWLLFTPIGRRQRKNRHMIYGLVRTLTLMEQFCETLILTQL
jgi:hypothetical protein